MSLTITAKDYMDCMKASAKIIEEKKDYITELDAATGDGDHWVNINMGFQSLLKAQKEISSLPIDEALKKIGIIMMNKIGGSSGILYGGAYLAAGTKMKGETALNMNGLEKMLTAMLEDMMKRGNTKPGYKTMVDSLYPAVKVLGVELKKQRDLKTILDKMCKAAADGAEQTRHMPAVKGRASYMVDKGIGHLDPGAVTMSYQIQALCEVLSQKI